MHAEQLLKASSVHYAAGDAGLAVDSAAWAYAVAPDEGCRADAAAAAALGLIELELPSDALVWGEWALTAVPGHRMAMTCRGLGHRALGRLEAALADLDAAVADGDLGREIPPRARFARGCVLDELGRRPDGYQELVGVVDDQDVGRLALRSMGSWRLSDGDLDLAVEHLTAAARLGDRRALAQLLEVVKALPDDPELWLTRLIALRIAEQVPQATELADELLARVDLPEGSRVRALINRGHIARITGGWAEALTWFERAVDVAGHHPEAVTEFGRALSETGETARAEEILCRAVDLVPGDGGPEMCLGQLHQDAGRPELALEWYERALAIVPCATTARRGLATALLSLGSSDEGARLTQLAAIAGDATAIEWCRDRGRVLPADQLEEVLRTSGTKQNPFGSERWLREAAATWLDYSVGAGDNPTRMAAIALWNAAICELAMGDPAAAETTLTRAIELRPGLAVAWQTLGDALVLLRRPYEALDAYDRCAWFDPKSAAASAGKSEALCQLGNGIQALACLDHAVELGYPDDPARQQRLHFRRARLRQALGDWEGAMADFGRLVGGASYDGDDLAEWLRGVTVVRDLALTGPEGLRPAEYRRYGMTREEWDGYGGIDWPVRVRFQREPDQSTRVRLAGVIGRCLRAALDVPEEARPVIDLAVTTHWSGQFLLLRLRADEGDNLGRLRAPLALTVDALHREFPIREVVNFAAQGVATSQDPDEAWSVAVAPVPDAGPDFYVPIGFWVPAVAPAVAPAAVFAEPVTDAAADEALAGALTGEQSAAEVKLVLIGPGDPPPPGPSSCDLGGLRRYQHDYGRFVATGVGVVVRRPGEFFTHLDRVTADGQVFTVVDGETQPAGEGEGLSRQIEAVSVAEDGTFAMFATALGRDLYLLDLATGATAVLMEGVPKVESTAFLPNGEIMVKTMAWLAIFRLTPEGPVLVARDFAATGPAVVAAGGRVIVAGGVREPELVVYGLASGALERLAELSAPINCYRVWAVGDRVFAADRSEFELVGLLPAWEKFATWAARIPGSEPGEGGLIVEELDDVPYTGIGDGLEGIRSAAFWCVKGSAGLLMAVREVEEGHEVLVGDPLRVVPTTPPLRQSGFEYDWRPDGLALLIRGKDSAIVTEVDVARATATSVAYSAGEACYTTTGFAVLRPDTLTLYAWRHGSEDEPVELVRIPVAEGATTLGWADGGRVLHMTAAGATGLYVVGDGALYPIGAFPGEDWFSGWNHGGCLYFSNRHSGRDFRAYRLSGFNSAVVEALGRAPVERLVPAELPPLRLVERPVYPGTTRWRFFSDV